MMKSELKQRGFRHDILVIIILLFFLACSDNDNDSTGVDPNDDTEIIGAGQFESIDSVLVDIENLISNSNQNQPIAVTIAGAAEALKTNEMVATVETHTDEGEDYISIEFSNGVHAVILFVNSNMSGSGPSPTNNADGYRTPQLSVSKVSSLRSNFTEVLPEQNPPCALFGQHSKLVNDPLIENIGPSLEALADKHGYDADYGCMTLDKFGNMFMSVEFFKNINEYALVWLSSHALHYVLNGVSSFMIMTDDICTQSLHDHYWNNGDFKNKRVGIAIRRPYSGSREKPDIKKTSGKYYVITNLFIDHYCGNFPSNAIVFLDMCQGARQTAPMVTSLLQKNAGAVLGWSNSVHWAAMTGASKYLLTRLFGEIPDNLSGCLSVNGSSSYCTPKKEPPIRPFGLNDSFEGLKKLGWDVDNQFAESPGGSLSCLKKESKTEINLIPSINKLFYAADIKKDEKFMSIHGNFGEKPGKVTLDGNEVPWLNWEHDNIIVDLKGTTNGGPIVVDVNGLKSNPHPLSAWEGKLELSGNLGTNQPTIDECSVCFQFRTEIVDERPNPEADPDPVLGNNGGNLEGECEVMVSLSGFFKQYECEYNFNISQNKDKIIKLGYDPEETFVGTIGIGDGKAKFHITVVWKGKVEKTCPGDLPEIIDQMFVLPLYFETPVDQYGTIEANSVTVGAVTIKWEDDIKPSSAPDEDTQR